MTGTVFCIKSCDDKPTLHECTLLSATHATLQLLLKQTLPFAADYACNCNVHCLAYMSAVEPAQVAAQNHILFSELSASITWHVPQHAH